MTGGTIEKHWSLPRDLHASDVENLSNIIAENQARHLTIDITELNHAQPMAEGRLLQCLARAQARDVTITLKVNLDTPKNRPTSPEHVSKVFSQSMSGILLAQHATSILNGSPQNLATVVHTQQEITLKETGGLVGAAEVEPPDSALAAPVFDRWPRPKASPIALEDDIGRFADYFRTFLFYRLALPRCGETETVHLIRFAFEALQNTRDHARLDITGKPIEGIRFILVRRLGQLDGMLSTGSTRSTQPRAVCEYVAALKQELTQDPDLATAATGQPELLEVTIADSGIGIPAAMYGSAEIYNLPLEQERGLLQAAVKPTGTSKKSSVPGAGLGLYKVMRAAEGIRGMVVFRTGRLCMYRHYLAGNPPWPDLDLEHWGDEPCSRTEGTSVSLIFPWIQKTPKP
jgi:hypothetical protein